MSKLERIQTFLSVIEANGFAAAARIKGISTAAISRQISALETDLGVELIQRTTRQIQLTEIGEVYYQQCKKTLSELNDAEIAISESRNEASGDLRVMVNRYFAAVYLLPKLSEFMKQNPNLRVHLQLAERFPNLEKEGIDILFGVSVEGSSQLVRRRVTTTRYVLCATPAYLKKYGVPKKPTDLINHRYITHSIRNPNDVIHFKNEVNIHMTPILWLNDAYAMLECALNDMGIVNLHDYMVSEALLQGKLIQILAEYQMPETQVYLYYQQNRFLHAKIRRFIDFYISEIN